MVQPKSYRSEKGAMILKNKETRITNLTIGLLLILAIVGGFYMVSTQRAYGAPDDSSYELVWKEDFNGTELNNNDWSYC